MKTMTTKTVLAALLLEAGIMPSIAQNPNPQGLWYAGTGNDTVKTNRFALINNSAHITMDLNVSGSLKVDTAKASVLKVGNSLTITDEGPFPFNRQQQASSDGVITFVRDLNFGNLNDIKFGMGQFPFNPSGSGPKANLHIHDQRSPANAVTQMFTNSVTGYDSTDGFQLGIDNTGAATLINKENSPMVFGTSNTPRMTIDAAGNVSINTLPNLGAAGTTDRLVTANSAGELKDIDFPATTNQFLRGDGTWATPAGCNEEMYKTLEARISELEKQLKQLMAMQRLEDTEKRNVYVKAP